VGDSFYFGGGSSETALLPIVAVLMTLTIILMLGLPRKYAVVPFLLATFLLPRDQVVVIAGVHFFVQRIIVLAAWLGLAVTKLSSSSRLFGRRLDIFDAIFAVWALYHAFAFLVVFQFASGAAINQAGQLVDLIGTYFLLRYLIRDDQDILRVLKTFAVVAVIVGICMLNEKLRGQNLFGYLGGRFTPEVREGATRAQGPFAHAILAGSFGATSLPLFVWLGMAKKTRTLAVAAVLACTVMVLASASSTPLLAYVAGIIAISFWPMRKHMRKFRWGLVIGLLVLHLVMKAPVWFLIERVSIVGGSSGFHRAELVDQFIKHFGDWWLFGTNTNDSWGNQMIDLSNQFVAEGESGGLVSFICFIAMISICFSRIGKARKLAKGDRARQWYFWLFGAAMLAHIVAYFGIGYFDHMQVAWFALLAMIIAATAPILAMTSAPGNEVHEVQLTGPGSDFVLPSHLESGADLDEPGGLLPYRR